MTKPFSVMKEPVVPVVFSDGTEQEIGIRDVFVYAHDINDLQCKSPLEEYAVFRLLVAIAMDMLRPKRWMDRRDLLEIGKFDAAKVDDYIAECELDGPRFDLFDPVHPFMQTAYDPAVDEKAMKPVAALSVSLPSGNNHIFLDHRMENMSAMTPAEAFRALIALNVFCTAAAQGYPSSVNNTPPVYTRILGSSLYEMIILNMVGSKEQPQIEDGYEFVPWRTDIPVIPKKEQITITKMEGLTWQPRRVCLFVDDDGMVRKVALQQGKDFKGNDLWRDPHVAYRCNKKGVWSSVKPQIGRALWRDIGTLLADRSNEQFHPPLTVSNADNVLGDSSSPLLVKQVGVATSNASYLEWSEDKLSIPMCLLENDVLASVVRGDTDETEFLQSELAQCINKRFGHDSKHGTDVGEQARLSFLGEMHDIIFGFSIPDAYRIRDNITKETIQEHIRQFNILTEETLLKTMRTVVQGTGSTSRALYIQVEAEQEAVFRFRKYASERRKQYE